MTVIVEVAPLPGATVFAGLYGNKGNYVHAFYNKNSDTVGLETAVDGVVYERGSTQPDEQRLFDAPFSFPFVANENEVTALVGDRSSDIGDFRPIMKREVTRDDNGTPDPTDDTPTGLDLRIEDVLTTYKNGFGAF